MWERLCMATNNHVDAFSVVLERSPARHAFAALIDVSVCGRRIGLVPSMMLLQSMKFFFFFFEEKSMKAC